MEMMEIKIATKREKKRFVQLQKEAFPNLNEKKQSKYFDLKIKNKEMFVLFDNGNYAGHICFGEYLLAPPFSGGVFVEELAVDKKFRGKGFGKKLVLHLSNCCKKKKIMMVYASTGDYRKNKSMIFWKKIGFKKVGKMKEVDPNSEYKYGQIFLARIIK